MAFFSFHRSQKILPGTALAGMTKEQKRAALAEVITGKSLDGAKTFQRKFEAYMAEHPPETDIEKADLEDVREMFADIIRTKESARTPPPKWGLWLVLATFTAFVLWAWLTLASAMATSMSRFPPSWLELKKGTPAYTTDDSVSVCGTAQEWLKHTENFAIKCADHFLTRYQISPHDHLTKGGRGHVAKLPELSAKVRRECMG
jgi:hypothetical protein